MSTSKSETTQKGTTPEQVTLSSGAIVRRSVASDLRKTHLVGLDVLPYHVTLPNGYSQPEGFSSTVNRCYTWADVDLVRSLTESPKPVSLIRSEALEEAARACEQCGANYPLNAVHHEALNFAASRIRSLSSQSVSLAHQGGAPQNITSIMNQLEDVVIGCTEEMKGADWMTITRSWRGILEKAFGDTHPVPGPETKDGAFIPEGFVSEAQDAALKHCKALPEMRLHYDYVRVPSMYVLVSVECNVESADEMLAAEQALQDDIREAFPAFMDHVAVLCHRAAMHSDTQRQEEK